MSCCWWKGSELPVYPVVMVLLSPGDGNGGVACYHGEFMGLVAHQDYRVVEAWGLEAREVLEREVLALVPYVPLMAGADESTVRAGVELLRRRGMGEEMEVVLALFASFVMDAEQVRFDLSSVTAKELASRLQAIAELPRLRELLVDAAQVENVEAFSLWLNGAGQSGGDGHLRSDETPAPDCAD